MRLRVLGCSGGIGGRHLRTTSFLLDGDILIDAGTGVGDLTLAELSQIDHVFITHSHLDHVTSIPFLVDTVGGMRSRPLVVYATRATIEILRNHLFNWAIWPDFTEIPTSEAPFMRYRELELGAEFDLGGRKIIPIPARHTVPAVGYHLDSGAASLVFTGDTGANDALWRIVNRIENLKYLIIETERSNDVVNPGNDITIFPGDDPNFPAYCAGKGTANPASSGGGLFAYRHRMQMNVLFVDGHVAAIPFETNPLDKPSRSKWYLPRE